MSFALTILSLLAILRVAGLTVIGRGGSARALCDSLRAPSLGWPGIDREGYDGFSDRRPRRALPSVVVLIGHRPTERRATARRPPRTGNSSIQRSELTPELYSVQLPAVMIVAKKHRPVRHIRARSNIHLLQEPHSAPAGALCVADFRPFRIGGASGRGMRRHRSRKPCNPIECRRGGPECFKGRSMATSFSNPPAVSSRTRDPRHHIVFATRTNYCPVCGGPLVYAVERGSAFCPPRCPRTRR